METKQHHRAKIRHYQACANILKQARDKILLPSNHCKGSYAKTAEGKTVAVRSLKAVSFDILGAINSVMRGRNQDVFASICDSLKLSIADTGTASYPINLSQWQDANSHELILAIMFKSIEHMRRKIAMHEGYLDRI